MTAWEKIMSKFSIIVDMKKETYIIGNQTKKVAS